jgi:hypothetical protein
MPWEVPEDLHEELLQINSLRYFGLLSMHGVTN